MTPYTRRAALVGTAIIGAGAAFAIRQIGWLSAGTPMRSESLQARLAAAGLGRVANDITRFALPSIRMHCRRAGDQAALPLGGSRLGGAPDLPSGKSWPAWQDAPIAFVAQVNLADIAAHDEEGHLPHAGLLSFFCTIDGTAAGVLRSPGDPSSWMVSHADGDLATLVRLPVPRELPESLQFPACPASFSRELTLPDVESREILSLGLSEPERRAYIDVVSGADAGYLSVMTHHLLGHPYTFGQSPYLGGYLKAHGIPDPYMLDLRETQEEAARRAQELQQKRRELEHKAELEWRLLLQVFSNEDAEMDFGGGGVLHFCIPKEALPRRDFDRVWVDMQFV